MKNTGGVLDGHGPQSTGRWARHTHRSHVVPRARHGCGALTDGRGGGGGAFLVAGAGPGFLRSVLVVEVSVRLRETYAKRLALTLSQGQI